jgi:hypothetical protein
VIRRTPRATALAEIAIYRDVSAAVMAHLGRILSWPRPKAALLGTSPTDGSISPGSRDCDSPSPARTWDWRRQPAAHPAASWQQRRRPIWTTDKEP